MIGVLLPHVAKVMWRALSPGPWGLWGPAQALCFWLLNSWISLWANLLESPDLFSLVYMKTRGKKNASYYCTTLKRKTSFLAQLFKRLPLFPLLFPSQYLYSFLLSASLSVTYPFLPWLKAEIDSMCVDCAGSPKLCISILEKGLK